MAYFSQTFQLNNKPLNYFKPFFSALPTPEIAALKGLYQAEFTGPAWLRAAAPLGLTIGGLGGWWGKEFMGNGTGINIVTRGGKFQRILPVTLELGTSLLDRKPAILIQYHKASRFPWPHVVDELRRLDDTNLLGLTIFNVGPLYKLPLPFLLHYREKCDGL